MEPENHRFVLEKIVSTYFSGSGVVSSRFPVLRSRRARVRLRSVTPGDRTLATEVWAPPSRWRFEGEVSVCRTLDYSSPTRWNWRPGPSQKLENGWKGVNDWVNVLMSVCEI